MSKQIEQIRTMAARVADQHKRMESAFTEEQAAEAAVLEAAIEAARPALPALVSRLIALDETIGVGTDKVRHRQHYHEQRGVVIAGDARERKDAPRDTRGRYEGEALVLLEDGTLARRLWGGQWSRWIGSTDTLTSTLEPYASIADAVADGWDAEEAIAGIAEALESQVEGDAEKRTQEAHARAEKLRGILALMR